jgi:hypothetical protein
MIKTDLESRTYKWLKDLAKSLNLSFNNNIRKTALIDLIVNSKKEKRIKIAINNLGDEKFSNSKYVHILGIKFKRKIALLFGLIILVFSIFSFSANEKIKDVFNSEVKFVNELSLTTLAPSNSSYYNSNKIVNPLCGCEKEMEHYGISFFCKNYQIQLRDSIDKKVNYNLSISSPNYIAPKVELDSISGMYYKYNTNFDVVYEIYNIPKFDFEMNRSDLPSFINKYYEEQYEKGQISKFYKSPNNVTVLNLKDDIDIVSLESVFFSSISPPYDSNIKFNQDYSSLQNKVTGLKISSYIDLKKSNNFVPSVDILGNRTAIIFPPTDIYFDEDTVLNYTGTNDNVLTMLVIYTGFTIKLDFDSKESDVKNFNLVSDKPINNEEFESMRKLLEQVREAKHYTGKTKDDTMEIDWVLNPPFLKENSNGIHYHGKFKNLYSKETLGKITLKNKTQIFEEALTVKYEKIDSMVLRNQPIVVQSKDNPKYINKFKTNGLVQISNDYFKSNFISKLFDLFMASLKEIFIGIIGTFITFLSTRGLSFFKK